MSTLDRPDVPVYGTSPGLPPGVLPTQRPAVELSPTDRRPQVVDAPAEPVATRRVAFLPPAPLNPAGPAYDAPVGAFGQPADPHGALLPVDPAGLPSSGVPAPAALPSRRTLREVAPPNRTERRRRARTSPARRPHTRVAQGAVAVGLALSVGTFALQPGGSGTDSTAAGRGVAPVDAEDGSPVLTAEVVQERKQAMLLGLTAVEQASSVRAAAEALSIGVEQTRSLDLAVAELNALLVETQRAQPAVTELQPETAPTGPVASSQQKAAVQADAEAVTAAQDAAAVEDPTAAAAVVAEDPATASLRDVIRKVERLTGHVQEVARAAEQAAAEQAAAEAAAAEAAAAQRAAEEAAAAEAARKVSQSSSLDGYENGQIPESAMCGVNFSSGQLLRCDAAEALEALNDAFRATFGTDLAISGSYRSYEAQVSCRASKGYLCAEPGTSNHGYGLAVDLGQAASKFGTTEHNWLLEHAEEYGWTLPSWARPGGSKPEPWHWEYIG